MLRKLNQYRCILTHVMQKSITFALEPSPVPDTIPRQTLKVGREPWSSGYGSRLIFQRSWVRIPALYTEWTFSH